MKYLNKNKIEKNNFLTALVADKSGKIFELEGFCAVGTFNFSYKALTIQDSIKMPYGSELMMLPDRKPILYNLDKSEFEILDNLYPVAVFNSPGYIASYITAYEENTDARHLPLFSYGAIGWHQGEFRSCAILIDKEKRQDLRFMSLKNVALGVKQARKIMPNNKLREHLERCALEYSCPAGKNFFLKRFEAPLPTSQSCNANCMGCLSLQKNKNIKSTQERINFTPTPEDIAEVALGHIRHVKSSIVSFGQGCEGEPLLASHVIAPAIKLIRSKTKDGTINLNTNGSKPDVLEKLFDLGLDSVRISLNSLRETCYNSYFRPNNNYNFSEVLKSIEIGIKKQKFVSINYLNMAGFTDSQEEQKSLINFLSKYKINLIQWRNLNFDPLRYWLAMNKASQSTGFIGMKNLLKNIKSKFGYLKHGYFNPAKENF